MVSGKVWVPVSGTYFQQTLIQKKSKYTVLLNRYTTWKQQAEIIYYEKKIVWAYPQEVHIRYEEILVPFRPKMKKYKYDVKF